MKTWINQHPRDILNSSESIEKAKLLMKSIRKKTSHEFAISALHYLDTVLLDNEMKKSIEITEPSETEPYTSTNLHFLELDPVGMLTRIGS